ncbi:MAG: hypothetical protein HYZ51_04285 [Candidatus Doudnabacteria bacterium]|nr:hypothetical protein [Candidatus Doudnabacteria bacterium]
MKKSLYVFLCSLLGILMFLILHRLLVFAYLLISSARAQVYGLNMTYLEVLALDFASLLLALMLGSWYGIALGLKWYETIYEKKEYGGFVDHLVKHFWPASTLKYNLKDRVELVAQELKENVLELEHLAKTIKPKPIAPKPVKRRAFRLRPKAKKSS